MKAGLLALSLLFLPGCLPKKSFSQFAGFPEWFAAHPPSGAMPSESDIALLARYRPRIFLAPGAPGMIDFYRDYVRPGILYDGHGGVAASPVSRATLNAWKNDPDAELVHRPDGSPSHPVVYGRVDHDEVAFAAGRERFTFLTYNAVFRTSGMPATLKGWQRFLVSVVAPGNDWHQLDHYTAVTLALDAAGTPVAMTLQQHNDQHAYLFGDAVQMPADGRVAIDSAIGSNELYPHHEGKTRHRAVPFADARGLKWLILGVDKPKIAADDLTDGSREQDYELQFLPPSDAFYTFQGWLGAKRRLPGRQGPPGASYNTLPALEPFGKQMLSAWWREGSAEDYARIAGVFRGGDWRAIEKLPEAQAEPFYEAWRSISNPRRSED